MGDSMDNSNEMDVDTIPPNESNETGNDYLIALLMQQEELARGNRMGMYYKDIASLAKSINEHQNTTTSNESNDGTDNDAAIAEALQRNYLNEQMMINNLIEQSNSPFVKPANPNKGKNINIKDYHNTQLQLDIAKKYSHEYFKCKLEKQEASSIRKQIKEFYADFNEKTKNVFKNPDEQSQYLRNFLNNISRNLIENPLWADCEKEEQENAIIELEKTITKKLYDITFGPEVDIDEDALLYKKIFIHSWVEPRHFDLPDFDYHILEKAGNELSKVNYFKFYIDKIICIVNCIKLIEGAYCSNVSNKESLSTDELLSLLIFVILKTNPKKLGSNIKYIARYINPSLLTIGIYDYSLKSIWGSLTFIEKLSQTSLTITPEEYEAKIIEMEKIFVDKMNQNSTSGFNLIQTIKGLIFRNDSFASSTTEGDIPQGIFSHLDSVTSSHSIGRNGSSLSSNSITVNEYKKELNEKYKNNMNEPITRPFETQFTEEDENNLEKADCELKASLSISSNKDINENKS